MTSRIRSTVPNLTALCLTSVVLCLASAAQADSITVNMTVDNSYALFHGTSTTAQTFVGSDFNWTTTETYNFNLPSSDYLYVVTASDLSTAQGFLGQFKNNTFNYTFYSNDPQWQVMATGLGSGAPYTGSTADMNLLSAQLVNANLGASGTTASLGWTALTAGPANGGGPWGTRPLINAAARWVWYSSNGDPDPTTPGFNHDEWLVFRIRVGATPMVPEPGALALLASAGLSGAGLFLRRRRK